MGGGRRGRRERGGEGKEEGEVRRRGGEEGEWRRSMAKGESGQGVERGNCTARKRKKIRAYHYI